MTVTVYDGMALVRDRRRVALPDGRGRLRWTGVARLIDATSVRVGAAEGAVVVTQTLAAGAAEPEAALAAAVGGSVRVETRGGVVEGTLRGVGRDALVVETGDELAVIARDERVRAITAGEPPPAAPALEWDVDGRGGERLVELGYQTFGMSWSASYAFVVAEDSGTTEVTAWATVVNGSGVAFEDARVVLATPSNAPGAGGKPRAYPLDGTVTLPNGRPTQVALVAPRTVASSRVLVFDAVGTAALATGELRDDPRYGTREGARVEAFVEVENAAAAGLGRDLPAGPARVYVRQADGSLRWLADDQLAHVAAGGRVRLRLGAAPDVIGRRTQTEHSLDRKRRRLVEEVEVTLENRAAEPREVVVLERMARGEVWRMTWTSAPVAQEDGRTVRYVVALAPGATERLRYRVIYSW